MCIWRRPSSTYWISRQRVTLARGEVVYAVCGGGVDGSGALVGGDVGGVGTEDGAVEEGMLEGDAVELGAGNRAMMSDCEAGSEGLVPLMRCAWTMTAERRA